MSVWVVSKGHIDALVMGGVVFGIIDHTVDKNATGQLLWLTNVASVNARYGEDEECEAYRFEPVEAPLDAYGLAKTVMCYEYQASEYAGWQEGIAEQFCRELRTAVLASVGLGAFDFEKLYASPRFDAAPWGIDSPLEIAA